MYFLRLLVVYAVSKRLMLTLSPLTRRRVMTSFGLASSHDVMSVR